MGVNIVQSSAFSGCINLSNIIAHDSITSIGSEAFKNTKWINNQTDDLIYLNNWLIDYKGNNTSRFLLEIKEGTLGIAAQSLKDEINLTSISLPNSLKYID